MHEPSHHKGRILLSIANADGFDHDQESLVTVITAGYGRFECERLLKPSGVELMNLHGSATIEIGVLRRGRHGDKHLVYHGVVPLAAIQAHLSGARHTDGSAEHSWEGWLGLFPGDVDVKSQNAAHVFHKCLEMGSSQARYPRLLVRLQAFASAAQKQSGSGHGSTASASPYQPASVVQQQQSPGDAFSTPHRRLVTPVNPDGNVPPMRNSSPLRVIGTPIENASGGADQTPKRGDSMVAAFGMQPKNAGVLQQPVSAVSPRNRAAHYRSLHVSRRQASPQRCGTPCAGSPGPLVPHTPAGPARSHSVEGHSSVPQAVFTSQVNVVSHAPGATPDWRARPPDDAHRPPAVPVNEAAHAAELPHVRTPTAGVRVPSSPEGATAPKSSGTVPPSEEIRKQELVRLTNMLALSEQHSEQLRREKDEQARDLAVMQAQDKARVAVEADFFEQVRPLLEKVGKPLRRESLGGGAVDASRTLFASVATVLEAAVQAPPGAVEVGNGHGHAFTPRTPKGAAISALGPMPAGPVSHGFFYRPVKTDQVDCLMASILLRLGVEPRDVEFIRVEPSLYRVGPEGPRFRCFVDQGRLMVQPSVGADDDFTRIFPDGGLPTVMECSAFVYGILGVQVAGTRSEPGGSHSGC